MKLVAALFVAKVFGDSRQESLGLRDIAGPGMAVGLLALLIAAAPDLGTAFCLIPLFLSVAFLAGLRMKAVASLAIVLLVVGGIGWQYALKDYQKSRIYTFLDPSLDPKGAGYQKIQSQIAVGSGGLLGKGFRQGSQAQLGYLPARHTDFIFSVLAEETGFLGVSWCSPSTCSCCGGCSTPPSSRGIAWGPAWPPRSRRRSHFRLCTISPWWLGSCPSRGCRFRS